MIMVTATRDQTVKVKALEAGFNDFLAKPFDPVELRARVANMLVLSHLHKQLARATKP
jgi:putative two-component system response regulator